MRRAGSGCLPDPVFNGINASTGQLDSGAILAANRIIPIEPAPNYNEGLVTPSAQLRDVLVQLPYPGRRRRQLSTQRPWAECPAPPGIRV